MSYSNLLVHEEGGVLQLSIHRPKVLNALNSQTLTELGAALRQEAADPSVRVVVITGAGERAFVAGADINEMKDLSPWEFYQFVHRGHHVFNALAQLEKPVIAAINGFCLGGGLELALACDIRIASPTAKLGFPEIKLGVLPGWGGTKRLAQLVGRARAKELILTGRMIDAPWAERIGLVNSLADPADLAHTALTMAKQMAAYSPITLRLAKSVIEEAPDQSWEGIAELEARTNALCIATEDTKEGIQAFLEKRQPHFQGR